MKTSPSPYIQVCITKIMPSDFFLPFFLSSFELREPLEQRHIETTQKDNGREGLAGESTHYRKGSSPTSLFPKKI
jgi:hypothetical protein